MISNRRLYLLSYVILVISLLVSGYLLFTHFTVASGKSLETDLCSIVFGKGCTMASLSKASQFLKIPIAGWGLVYSGVMGTYLLIHQYVEKKDNSTPLQIAFWLAVLGALVSLYYLILMLVNPVLFCPFCAVFHILNFVLLYALKKINNQSLGSLFRNLKNGIKYVFLGQSASKEFHPRTWLAILFPLLIGLSLYQWTLLQGVSMSNQTLSNYSPLKDIEAFQAEKIWDISITEEDPFLGPEDATVTLVVFSDFQCSVCKMFASNFIPLLDYNQNDLKIVFKYFPLSSRCNPMATTDLHPLACQAAVAAQAAHKQNKFWDYHDLLFSYGVDQNPDIFIDIANELNMNTEQFIADVNAQDCALKVSNDINLALDLNIDSTPTAFLNGRKLKKLSQENINFLIKFLK